MRTRTRSLLFLLAALAGACDGTDASSSRDASPDLAPDVAADVADAPPALPAVVGPPEFEDHNADPRVIEVDLVASEGDATLVAGRTTASPLYNGRTPGPTPSRRASRTPVDGCTTATSRSTRRTG
jgi:hypothetical protein